MDKAIYRILKEIVSLSDEIKGHEKVIAAELARIEKIELMRTKRTDQKEQDIKSLEERRKDFQQAENDIANLQAIIDKSNAHIKSVFDENEIKALTSQITQAEEKLSPLENLGLELMDTMEELEKFITDADQFLKGSLESIKEIEAEVMANNGETYTAIKTLNQRLSKLKTDVPEKALEIFEGLVQKKLTHGPLSRLDGSSCFICRYAVTPIVIQEIETHLKFRRCKGCSRIFIPETSLY